MANTQFINQIRGWIPALDAKQVAEHHVVDGRNFLVDAEGPYSAFASELLSYAKLFDAKNAAAIEVDTEIFIFTNSGVFTFDPIAERYVPLLEFDTVILTTDPWSFAEVGGFHYFMKSGSGLIEYAHEEGEIGRGVWSIRNDPGLLPDPRFITMSYGRLIIQTDVAVQWSGLDKGRELQTDSSKGIGFQLTAIVGDGRALGVFATDDGFISYTTTGAMKSKFVRSDVNFSHDELTDTPRPLTPHTIVITENDEHIYLSKQGLYKTSGRKPEVWQPLFTEYLVRKLFSQFDITIPGAIKLAYNSTTKILAISYSSTQRPFSYNIAAVIYVPRGEWGLFNRNHTVIGEFAANEGLFPGRDYGFIDPENNVYKFSSNPVFEIPPDLANYYYAKRTTDYNGRVVDGVSIMTSLVRLQTELASDYPDTTGLFNIKTGDVYNPDLQAIDSFVDVGLVRFTNDEYPNWESTVMQVVASMNDPVDVNVFIDRNTQPENTIDRNLGAIDIFIDRGFGEVSGNNYELDVIGTLDGYNQYYNAIESATEVMFDQQLSRSKFWTCDITARYITLRFKALNPDQSYHLKFLEVNGILAGRAQG